MSSAGNSAAARHPCLRGAGRGIVQRFSKGLDELAFGIGKQDGHRVGAAACKVGRGEIADIAKARDGLMHGDDRSFHARRGVRSAPVHRGRLTPLRARCH